VAQQKRAPRRRRWRPRNPLARFRDTAKAQKAAYIGGVLLIITGGTGAFTTIAFGAALVDNLAPEWAEWLQPLFVAATLVATLGGVSVLAAGWMLMHNRFVGKVLLLLGSGVGLLGFAAQVAALVLAGGDVIDFTMRLVVTFQGLAVVTILYAQVRA
jgi:hypothetical protein